MDPTSERVVRLWDALADSYDQVGVDFISPIAARLVDELAPQPGERALDLGCGRGAALLPTARRVGLSGFVVGGDVSPRMVEACRTLALDEGLSQVDVLVIDAQSPDQAVVADALGGPADVVSSSLVLFFLPEPVTALTRWRELTRPGGRVGVSTFADRDPAWEQLDAVFDPYLPPGMLDARTSGASGPFASDAGVEGMFGDAGYVETRTAHRRVEVRFDDPEHWYRFSMSLGQRAFWLAVPEEQRAEVKARAFDLLRGSAAPDGSVTYWQDARYTLGHRP